MAQISPFSLLAAPIFLNQHVQLSLLAECRNFMQDRFIVPRGAPLHHYSWGEVQMTDVLLPGLLIRDWHLSTEQGINFLLRPDPGAWGIHYLQGDDLILEIDGAGERIEDGEVILTNHVARQIRIAVPVDFNGSLVSIYFDPKIGGKNMTSLTDKFDEKLVFYKDVFPPDLEHLLFENMLFDSERSLLDAHTYLNGSRTILNNLFMEYLGKQN